MGSSASSLRAHVKSADNEAILALLAETHHAGGTASLQVDGPLLEAAAASGVSYKAFAALLQAVEAPAGLFLLSTALDSVMFCKAFKKHPSQRHLSALFALRPDLVRFVDDDATLYFLPIAARELDAAAVLAILRAHPHLVHHAHCPATVLHYAVDERYNFPLPALRLACEQLQARGAACGGGGHIDMRDGSGLTALQWACARGNEAAARVLLEHGADAAALPIVPTGGRLPAHFTPTSSCVELAVAASHADLAARLRLVQVLAAAGGARAVLAAGGARRDRAGEEAANETFTSVTAAAVARSGHNGAVAATAAAAGSTLFTAHNTLLWSGVALPPWARSFLGLQRSGSPPGDDTVGNSGLHSILPPELGEAAGVGPKPMRAAAGVGMDHCSAVSTLPAPVYRRAQERALHWASGGGGRGALVAAIALDELGPPDAIAPSSLAPSIAPASTDDSSQWRLAIARCLEHLTSTSASPAQLLAFATEQQQQQSQMQTQLQQQPSSAASDVPAAFTPAQCEAAAWVALGRAIRSGLRDAALKRRLPALQCYLRARAACGLVAACC